MKAKMKALFSRFFKKRDDFTGFEIRLWKNGKLMTYSVSDPGDIFVYHLPVGQAIRTKSGYLTGYNLVPHITSY